MTWCCCKQVWSDVCLITLSVCRVSCLSQWSLCMYVSCRSVKKREIGLLSLNLCAGQSLAVGRGSFSADWRFLNLLKLPATCLVLLSSHWLRLDQCMCTFMYKATWDYSLKRIWHIQSFAVIFDLFKVNVRKALDCNAMWTVWCTVDGLWL